MQHPPFSTGADAVSGANVSSHAGAQKLAARIAAAWQRVGVEVAPELVHVSNRGEGFWAVRLPQLVNGMPRRGQ